MNEVTQDHTPKELLNIVVEDIKTDSQNDLKNKLHDCQPAETANLLESMPPTERQILWESVPEEHEGDVLAHMHNEARATIIDKMEQDDLIAAVNLMEVADQAEVLEDLSSDFTELILNTLDDDHRQRLEKVLNFEADTAGRLMSTDVISIRQNVSLSVVLRWLRHHSSLPSHTDALMVIDDENRYIGKLNLSDLVTNNKDEIVANVMQTNADTIKVDTKVNDIANLFERRDLISVPVIEKDGHLLGRITIDDVVDIIREQADETLLKSAGLKEEEDLFAPIIPSAKRRAFWLGINLITVFLAAWVIGQFEEVLEKIVALAVLMPIVASMGGIAGSQTLTLTIRGLALDQIARSNIRWLTIKEILVGLLNGLAWAIIVAIVSYLWFENEGVSLIIATAMILNLLAGSLSGVAIPLILKKIGIDPALAGAVILTTITDVIGFLSFLGLASLFLI